MPWLEHRPNGRYHVAFRFGQQKSGNEDSAVVDPLLDSITALWPRLPTDARVAIGVLVESLLHESG